MSLVPSTMEASMCWEIDYKFFAEQQRKAQEARIKQEQREVRAAGCRDDNRWNNPLYVRHDERADRTVITAVSKAHMAMEVLTRLHLLTLEEVAGWDIEPAGKRFHQLIAGDREAIHIPAAG
jgi:hypothetical protein